MRFLASLRVFGERGVSKLLSHQLESFSPVNAIFNIILNMKNTYRNTEDNLRQIFKSGKVVNINPLSNPRDKREGVKIYEQPQLIETQFRRFEMASNRKYFDTLAVKRARSRAAWIKAEKKNRWTKRTR